MLESGIKPELEAFDLGMINYAKYLIRKGLLKPPYYFNLILGNIACAQPNMLNLGLMVNELPENSLWSVGGIGDWQLQMNAMAIVSGGGVRVGLEDNIYFDQERSRLALNRELVERILLVAKALGREPYSHKEAREILCKRRRMMKHTIIYFKHLWSKARHSSLLRLFFDGLARLEVRIAPYYLFQEIISPENPPKRPSGFEDYEMSFWGLEEIKQMALIPVRKFSEEFLVQRLKDGQKCIGLKKDNELAAFSWCNLKEISVKWNLFPLKKDEAYLFDAYTLLDYRGKGIAPFLSFHLYKELQKLGRTKLYSYSDYFNTSAVRFKQKLGAKKIKLFLVIDLFGKWYFSFLLKNFQN